MSGKKPTTTQGIAPVEFCKMCGAHGGMHYGACRGYVEPVQATEPMPYQVGGEMHTDPVQATEPCVEQVETSGGERGHISSSPQHETTYTGIGHSGQAGRPHVCNPVDSGPSCYDEGIEAERARIERIIEDFRRQDRMLDHTRENTYAADRLTVLLAAIRQESDNA